MPFFWFEGGRQEISDAKPSVPASSHHRKASLSLSTSGRQNPKLTEVRNKATASYLQKESARSRTMSSGSRELGQSSGRRSRVGSSGHGNKRGGIIAIEDDDPSTHRGRIDQGLIDACNEAKASQEKASWWTSFSATAITPSSSPPTNNNAMTNVSSLTDSPSSDGAPLKHRRIVSKTTYRV